MPDNRSLRLLALYVSAVIIGVASAWLWLTRAGITGVDAGAWRVNLLAGSANADAYTRARIALGAVLALDRSETLYYTTSKDDAGNPLRAECDYLLEGAPPPSRWWSITAYAADNFLFATTQHRYSVGSGHVTLDSRGRFSTALGPTAPTAADGRSWIPTIGNGGMRLTLRLYLPDPSLQRDPGGLAAPTIRPRGPCQ